ncbi:hypothetical protein AsFPU1_1102 [Aphanothece sacrum FPU1]|uniref:Uncharacterized protein n=1 Tax=Aphanothece sacrum FPU1 TaxID=1920663 RepID=A0A401IEK6_APHSA|nr:hypothetical protein AsFPU1_1102 [Aphanothece sacrum FPU1]
MGKGFSQPQLPPAGGTTPPYGVNVKPNTFTNIPPNRGPAIDFAGKSAKGNFNGGGGPIGRGRGVGGNGRVFAIVESFAVGLAIGNIIYKEAENPDSIVFKGIDAIDRKLRGGNQVKLNKSPKVESRGGVQISPDILPFYGGQVPDQQYIVNFQRIDCEVLVNGKWEGGYSAYNQGILVTGPISAVGVKNDSPTAELYIYAVGKNGEISSRGLSFGMLNRNPPVRGIPAGIEIFRVDGTSQQVDRAQGGNPQPTQIGTSEPRTTIINNTTNNTTNITNNYPPPFAEPEPPPKPWLPPPSIKPTPEPNKAPSPAGSPNPGSSSGSSPGSSSGSSPSGSPTSSPFGSPTGSPNPAPGNYPAPSGSTTLSPAPKISSGSASGSSGPQALPAPVAPAPFAEPEKPSNLPFPLFPLAPPVTSPNTSTTDSLKPVTPSGQPQTTPQTERERQGLPVPDSGGSCCALPAIQTGNNRILERLNGLNNAAQDALLLEVLNRLGPQVQGGLSGWLGRFSRSIRLDRVLSVLQFMLVLHNAGMLSRSLLDSISYLIDSAGQAFGLKDEDDNPINLTATIGSSVSSFLEGILGTELYSGLSYNWKKLSAIYTSAVNVYQLTTNSMAGIAEGLETVGNYTGKIGNALKRGGVIIENAYQWMDETLSIKSGKFAAIQKITDGISQADSIVNDLTSVTEEIIETKDNIKQIQTEFKTIQDNLKDKEKTKLEKENKARTDSLGPNIARENLLEAPEKDVTTN